MITNVLPCSRNKLKTIVMQLYLPATFSYHNCLHSDYSENAQYCKWIGQEDLIGFLSSPKNRFDAAGKMLEKLGTGAWYLLVIQLEGTNGNLFSVCSPLHFLTRLPSMR
ncbi:unnamed protein product [Prunus brigantina]